MIGLVRMDGPARFVYEVADSKLTVKYLLAPRINI